MVWPPGFIGEIAKYIYCNAHMPIPEFAIATSIAIHAGILGRGWGDDVLNQYIIILGPSTIGKDVIHSGSINVLRQMNGTAIGSFIHHAKIASAPAMTKHVAANPCSLVITPEVGKFWSGYARSKNGDLADQLATEMLTLWTGNSAGIRYSDSSKNVDSTSRIAFSTLGESVPKTFYETLKKDEIWSEGLPSRFLIIDYRGKRPSINERPRFDMPPWMRNRLAMLVQDAAMRTMSPSQPILLSHEAKQHLTEFTAYCAARISESGKDEMLLQAWGRMRQKALRLAYLLAATDDHTNPIVSKAHFEWARNMVWQLTSDLLERMKDETFAKDDDHTRRKMVLDRCNRWLTQPRHTERDERLRQLKLITRRFLQMETSSLVPFKSYKLGATTALDHTLKGLEADGYLYDVPKKKGDLGKVYQLFDLPSVSG